MNGNFARGFAAVVSGAIREHGPTGMAVLLLFTITIGSSLAFNLDAVGSVWAGLLTFIALGLILALIEFCRSCASIGAASQADAAPAQTAPVLRNRARYQPKPAANMPTADSKVVPFPQRHRTKISD